MIVDYAEEVDKTSIPIVDLPKSESIPEPPPAAQTVQSDPMAPQSATEHNLVNEIETAIENIKIESEPVHVRTVSSPPPVEASSNSVVVVDEDSKEDVSRVGDLDTGTEDDSMSIRRSSRIKTISKTNKKSRGHGLVRDREKMKVPSEADPSSTPSTPLPVSTEALPPLTPSDAAATEQKPQKIKSRWLDSAKRESLDLSNSLSIPSEPDSVATPNSTAITLPNDEAAAAATPTPVDYYAPDPEVIECLKQLNQIKDNIYTCERNISKEAKKMTCDCFLTADEKLAGELGCGEDCLNRLLMIECGSRCVVGDRCTNRRFQTHEYAPVVVFKTEMKGFGLRAASDIQGGEFIMEYVGEVLNAKQFDKRANAYSKVKNKHYYFMALRSDAVIDATGKGNISRFINHSCDPNAETQKWTVNGELRIGFFTTRPIAAGEEVTFDYQYQRYGKEAQKCFCEAANCRGWIGEEPDSEDEDDEDEEEEEDEVEGEDGEEVEDGEETDADDEESGAEEEQEDGKGPAKAGKGGKGKNGSKAAKQKKKAKAATAAAKRVKPKAAKKTIATAAKAATKKPRRTARSRRQEILDDLDLDAEIDALAKTGLKNQAHTLKLSRMMVRAKLPKTRMRLLALIQGGEGPCRRLFLDYHGLRLLHGWMTDAQEQRDAELKLEMVRTLQLLPIPNKTMLKDSHVLTAVTNYGGLKLDGERKEIVAEEGPLEVKFKAKEPKVEAVKEEPQETSVDGVVKMEVDQGEPELTEEEQAEVRRVGLENEVRAVCKKMILKWIQLPEVFRIPKKERIEQMKEHEREADMRYTTLGLPNEEQEKQDER